VDQLDAWPVDLPGVDFVAVAHVEQRIRSPLSIRLASAAGSTSRTAEPVVFWAVVGHGLP